MLKERLKELDIKITELANYLDISRPTMYKFIENYEDGNFDDINKNVKKIFDYIESNELIGKNNVISFILNKMTNVKEMEDVDEINSFKEVRKYIMNNSDTEKSQFISLCCKSNKYDLLIHYIMEITPLLRKRSLSDYEIELLKPYYEIIKKYMID